jgi:hypothetical protein
LGDFASATLGAAGAAAGADELGAGVGGTGAGGGAVAAGFVAAGFVTAGFVAAGLGVVGGVAVDGGADFGALGDSHQNAPATATTRTTMTHAIEPPPPLPLDIWRSLEKSGSPLCTSVAGTVGSIPSFSRAFLSASRDIVSRVPAFRGRTTRSDRQEGAMADQRDVRRIALSLPGAIEAESRFAFSVENKGKQKGFVWVWLERIKLGKPRVPRADVVAVRVRGRA